MSERWRELAWVLVLTGLLCVPYWVDTYRDSLHWYEGRDPYEKLLMYVAGDTDEPVAAPIAYRALSVAPAVPLYKVAPAFKFSQVHLTWPGDQRRFLKANFALATQHTGSIVLLCLFVFAVARRDHQATPGGALGASALAALLSGFVAANGVDGLGLAWIAALVFAHRTPWVLPLALLGGAANDKIALVLIGWAAATLAFDRGPDGRRLAGAAGLALLGYLAAVGLLPAEGVHHAMDRPPVERMLSTIKTSFGFKGLIQNLAPIGALCVAAAFGGRHAEPRAWVPRLAPVGLLLAVGVWAGVERNLGRVVLYATPVIAPMAALGVDSLLRTLRRE